MAILFLLLGLGAGLLGLLVLLAGLTGGETSVLFGGILLLIGTVFFVGSGVVEKLQRLETSVRESAASGTRQAPLV